MVKVLEKEVGVVGYGLMGSFVLSCLYHSLFPSSTPFENVLRVEKELMMNYD